MNQTLSGSDIIVILISNGWQIEPSKNSDQILLIKGSFMWSVYIPSLNDPHYLINMLLERGNRVAETQSK
jgi:hypothetical protein